jgi:hypothetical protein
MNKTKTRSMGVAMILLIIATAVAAEELIPSYDQNWFTIDHGGGISSANGFDLHGTIGQLDAAPESTGGAPGNVYSFNAGYWPGVEPEPLCPADVAPGIGAGYGDDVVNISDLLAIIANWGSSNPQFDIAPGSGDGTVNITDLLFVIASWGVCPI